MAYYNNPLHGSVTPGQQSVYSTLSGAMKPAHLKRYALPQTVHMPATGMYSAGSMAPIAFDTVSASGAGVPLRALSANLAELTPYMKGGSDLVFHQRPDVTRINFRVMWPGYPASETSNAPRSIIVDGATTRAKLAQEIANAVTRFMMRCETLPTSQPQHLIGPSGIRRDQVHLVSLQNIFDKSWQATLYIENL